MGPTNGKMHILRHAFCSNLAEIGVAPTIIQQLAGHGSLKVTEGYMHVADSASKEAVRALDAKHGNLVTQAQSSGDSTSVETASAMSPAGFEPALSKVSREHGLEIEPSAEAWLNFWPQVPARADGTPQSCDLESAWLAFLARRGE